MIDACKVAKRKLRVAYRCQFDPNHLECMRLAREKEFGDLRFIDAGFSLLISDPEKWRLKGALAGGGALMDVGIYALQAARYLSGEEPLQVIAFEQQTDPVKFAEVNPGPGARSLTPARFESVGDLGTPAASRLSGRPNR
jgi:predicted dehydrogenase